MSAPTIPQQRTAADPQALCEFCDKPRRGFMADCEEPDCVAASLDFEAFEKRRDDD